MSVFTVCDVIMSLRAAALKNVSVRAAVGRVVMVPRTVKKYLGLLQLHLGVSFLDDIRVLTLSLQERESNDD